jgi:hypothetical protein
MHNLCALSTQYCWNNEMIWQYGFLKSDTLTSTNTAQVARCSGTCFVPWSCPLLTQIRRIPLCSRWLALKRSNTEKKISLALKLKNNQSQARISASS